MSANRLVWVFAALFLLCGLPLLVVEQVGWARPLASGCLVFLGGFALALAADAMRTGRLRLQGGPLLRNRHPKLFAATIALVVLAGVGTLVAAVWAAFFKVW